MRLIFHQALWSILLILASHGQIGTSVTTGTSFLLSLGQEKGSGECSKDRKVLLIGRSNAITLYWQPGFVIDVPFNAACCLLRILVNTRNTDLRPEKCFWYCRSECFIDRNSCSDFVDTLYMWLVIFWGSDKICWKPAIQPATIYIFVQWIIVFPVQVLDRSVEHRA